jgi:hypothetical protein
MLFRIIAASVLCLCLLTVPALQAFGQDSDAWTALARAPQPRDPKVPPRTRVPEPSATLLLGLALGGVVALKRHRRG